MPTSPTPSAQAALQALADCLPKVGEPESAWCVVPTSALRQFIEGAEFDRVDAEPSVGDYVLATKYSDGDPGDNWALGWYAGLDRPESGRHMVHDNDGGNIRPNGFLRAAPIRADVGRWLLEVAAKQLERCPAGTVNLWTMLTPLAFDLESETLRVAARSDEQKGKT